MFCTLLDLFFIVSFYLYTVLRVECSLLTPTKDTIEYANKSDHPKKIQEINIVGISKHSVAVEMPDIKDTVHFSTNALTTKNMMFPIPGYQYEYRTAVNLNDLFNNQKDRITPNAPSQDSDEYIKAETEETPVIFPQRNNVFLPLRNYVFTENVTSQSTPDDSENAGQPEIAALPPLFENEARQNFDRNRNPLVEVNNPYKRKFNKDYEFAAAIPAPRPFIRYRPGQVNYYTPISIQPERGFIQPGRRSWAITVAPYQYDYRPYRFVPGQMANYDRISPQSRQLNNPYKIFQNLPRRHFIRPTRTRVVTEYIDHYNLAKKFKAAEYLYNYEPWRIIPIAARIKDQQASSDRVTRKNKKFNSIKRYSLPQNYIYHEYAGYMDELKITKPPQSAYHAYIYPDLPQTVYRYRPSEYNYRMVRPGKLSTMYLDAMSWRNRPIEMTKDYMDKSSSKIRTILTRLTSPPSSKITESGDETVDIRMHLESSPLLSQINEYEQLTALSDTEDMSKATNLNMTILSSAQQQMKIKSHQIFEEPDDFKFENTTLFAYYDWNKIMLNNSREPSTIESFTSKETTQTLPIYRTDWLNYLATKFRHSTFTLYIPTLTDSLAILTLFKLENDSQTIDFLLKNYVLTPYQTDFTKQALDDYNFNDLLRFKTGTPKTSALTSVNLYDKLIIPTENKYRDFVSSNTSTASSTSSAYRNESSRNVTYTASPLGNSSNSFQGIKTLWEPTRSNATNTSSYITLATPTEHRTHKTPPWNFLRPKKFKNKKIAWKTGLFYWNSLTSKLTTAKTETDFTFFPTTEENIWENPRILRNGPPEKYFDYPKADCYVCGLNRTHIPTYPTCYHFFKRVHERKKFKTKCPETNDQSGKAYRGGCFRRFLDIGEIYDERGCRYWPAELGQSIIAKRLRALESALWHVDEGCMSSPAAFLTPFSRNIALWARYYVCVCRGPLCNLTSKLTSSTSVVILCISFELAIKFVF